MPFNTGTGTPGDRFIIENVGHFTDMANAPAGSFFRVEAGGEIDFAGANCPVLEDGKHLDLNGHRILNIGGFGSSVAENELLNQCTVVNGEINVDVTVESGDILLYSGNGMKLFNVKFTGTLRNNGPGNTGTCGRFFTGYIGYNVVSELNLIGNGIVAGFSYNTNQTAYVINHLFNGTMADAGSGTATFYGFTSGGTGGGPNIFRGNCYVAEKLPASATQNAGEPLTIAEAQSLNTYTDTGANSFLDGVAYSINDIANPSILTGLATSGSLLTLNDSALSLTPGEYIDGALRISAGNGVQTYRRIADNDADTLLFYERTGTASGGTSNTLEDIGTFGSFDFSGYAVRIIDGTGAGQEKTIISNTSDSLTVDSSWSVTPDNTSVYILGEPFYEEINNTTEYEITKSFQIQDGNDYPFLHYDVEVPPKPEGPVTFEGVARPNAPVSIFSMTDLTQSNLVHVEDVITDGSGNVVGTVGRDPALHYMFVARDLASDYTGTIAAVSGTGDVEIDTGLDLSNLDMGTDHYAFRATSGSNAGDEVTVLSRAGNTITLRSNPGFQVGDGFVFGRVLKGTSDILLAD